MKEGSFYYKSKSSMDRGTRIKTLFVSILLIAVMLLGLFLERSVNTPIILLICLLLSALFIGFLNTPFGYSISENNLIIQKRISPIVIPIKEIVTIRQFEQADRKGLYRKFAAEGVLGNIGVYSSNNHKILLVFTSRDTNWVLVQTRKGKKYIISPNDLGLIEVANEAIKIHQK